MRKDLGVIPGDRCSHAYSINAKTQIVGLSGQCGSGIHAFIWEHDETVDLNDLVSPKSDVILREAYLVTNDGAIEVNGLPTGCTDQDACGHPYLLIQNGECDDACEANIKARQNAVAPMRQAALSNSSADSSAARADSIRRVRAELLRRLHLQTRPPTK